MDLRRHPPARGADRVEDARVETRGRSALRGRPVRDGGPAQLDATPPTRPTAPPCASPSRCRSPPGRGCGSRSPCASLAPRPPLPRRSPHPVGHRPRRASPLTPDPIGTLPPIGFGVASAGGPLSGAEIERLRPLRPAHLHVTLDLASPTWKEALNGATAEAAALGAALELEVVAGDRGEGLPELATALRPCLLPAPTLRLGGHPRGVARAFVFPRQGVVSTEPVLGAARRALAGAGVPVIGGGTRADFVKLNRAAPMPAPSPCPCWTPSPSPSTPRCTPSTTAPWWRPCSARAWCWRTPGASPASAPSSPAPSPSASASTPAATDPTAEPDDPPSPAPTPASGPPSAPPGPWAACATSAPPGPPRSPTSRPPAPSASVERDGAPYPLCAPLRRPGPLRRRQPPRRPPRRPPARWRPSPCAPPLACASCWPT